MDNVLASLVTDRGLEVIRVKWQTIKLVFDATPAMHASLKEEQPLTGSESG
jgi:hypothetical protein